MASQLLFFRDPVPLSYRPNSSRVCYLFIKIHQGLVASSLKLPGLGRGFARKMAKKGLGPASLPLRSTVIWKDRHTDVTIWPAHKRATALIVFISGNPGPFPFLFFSRQVICCKETKYRVMPY